MRENTNNLVGNSSKPFSNYYIYGKLKMSGPNGIITIKGYFKKEKECEAANAVHAEEEISRE